MTTNKEMFNMSSVRATNDSVGEWGGKEQKAADNINRIQDALYEAAPDNYNDDKLNDLMKYIWDYWGSREDLTTVTDNQIKEFVERWV